MPTQCVIQKKSKLLFMKQLRLICSVVLFSCTTLLISTASAQSSFSLKAPDSYLSYKKDSDYKLKDHLWYGGGLSLGFAGTSGASVFAFGVSPMVGYKIIGPLSAGPRLSVLYTSQKFQGLKAFNLFDVELSLFARVRVFKGLFVQGEVGTLSDQYVYLDSQGYGKGTRTRPAQYLGLGYNFANGQGGPGQEIAIMYDFYIAQDDQAYEQPWQYRLAFTFGF